MTFLWCYRKADGTTVNQQVRNVIILLSDNTP